MNCLKSIISDHAEDLARIPIGSLMINQVNRLIWGKLVCEARHIIRENVRNPIGLEVRRILG